MPFDTSHPMFQQPAIRWLIVVCVLALIGSFVGVVSSWLGNGNRGIATFGRVVGRGFADLVLLAPRRVYALATLTARESIRRKALWVGAVFLVLFMFAGWFIGDTSEATPAKPYISFVMTTIRWMLLPVAVLLACWGLPADIRDRSLHTVVTKPVRRSEVVLGRIGGYVFVITTLLLVVSSVGYAWVRRVVPERSQRQLISRVPLYASGPGGGSLDMGFQMLNEQGESKDKDGNDYRGVNVGDLIELRRFIQGGTKERVIWDFRGLSAADFPGDQDVRLEYAFEAFRSYKGDIDTEIQFSVTLVNPTSGLRVPMGATYSVNEFSSDVVHDLAKGETENLISIPRSITFGEGASKKTIDLFQDLVDGGALRLEVACMDASQYLGVNPSALFVRMPDRSFAIGYWKTIFAIWLLLVLVITIGTTASCILKGPVATLATFGLLILGSFLKDSLVQRLATYFSTDKQVVGGGSIEAFYRIITGLNESSPLEDTLGKRVIETLDSGVYAMLYLAQYIIPDVRMFDGALYTANGFDVPFSACILPSVLITLGFFIPAYIIGYFGLQVRELEAK